MPVPVDGLRASLSRASSTKASKDIGIVHTNQFGVDEDTDGCLSDDNHG
jgi:hypothetical protein